MGSEDFSSMVNSRRSWESQKVALAGQERTMREAVSPHALGAGATAPRAYLTMQNLPRAREAAAESSGLL